VLPADLFELFPLELFLLPVTLVTGVEEVGRKLLLFDPFL